MEKSLYTVTDVLNLTRNEVKRNCYEYFNPGLIKQMSLIGLDRIFVKAEGSYLWNDKGDRYIDFYGGIGSLNLGHNHPEVIAALQKVSTRPNILHSAPNVFASALAHNLAKITPGDLQYTFFCNSGAEAVEGALKTAKLVTGKKKIVYCDGSFHGKTIGALSVTGRKKYQEPFKPLVPECVSIKYGDLDSLEKALYKKDVAAFIVEPIQGEGGIIVPPPGYLKEAKKLCRKYDALMIADEVQTGFGRTGRMFAVEWEEVEPDFMCFAKALSGGVVPIGAFITTKQIWEKAYGPMDRCLLHSSTFGGNTWATAAGIAVINVLLKEGLVEEADKKGSYMLKKLLERKEKYKLVKDVRGRGLLIGLEIKEIKGGLIDKVSGYTLNKLTREYLTSIIVSELFNKYKILTIYTINNPKIIRLEPPLTIGYDDIDRVLAALDEIFEKHSKLLDVALMGAKNVLKSLLSKKH